MKKLLFIAATAAVALSSCSSDEEIANVGGSENLDGAVVFNAYTARATRASDIHDVDQAFLESNGFGVFAYEQGKAGFSTFAASTSYPNFFYNQKVKKSSGKWTYDPVKYYSNNEGAKHSFFAYAPYMDNSTLSPVFSLGKAPSIRYNVAQDIDLLWAAPTVDKLKAAVDENIEFNFKHSLSKVRFHVAPFFNKVHGDHGYGTPLTKGTKITVKSIRFIGNVPSQALLNLEDGTWTIENTQEGDYLVNVTPARWVDTESSDQTISSYADLTAIKVIPADQVKIEIVYDVVTTDGTTTSGANDHKETNVVISKESFDLLSGNAYDFYLDLGMTSVKFEAKVYNWGSTAKTEVDLPNNHDFHTVAYIDCGASLPTADTKILATKTNATDNKFYDVDTNQLLVCDENDQWASVSEGVYYSTTNKQIYDVDDKGNCVVYDYAKYNGKYYALTAPTADLEPTAILSITPDSEGNVQKTTGEWDAPTPKAYYTVGSFLYQWNPEYVASPARKR